MSKVSPLENIRIKKSGFHDVHVICSLFNNSSQNSSSVNDQHHVSSTSAARSPSLTAHTRFALPHVQLVCTFKDGGIGLYDLGHQRWKFLRDQVMSLIATKFCVECTIEFYYIYGSLCCAVQFTHGPFPPIPGFNTLSPAEQCSVNDMATPHSTTCHVPYLHGRHAFLLTKG